MLETVFYKSENGVEYVKDFLNEKLTDKARDKVDKAIKTVEVGFPTVAKRRLVEHVVDDIYEIRVSIVDGIVRIFFCVIDGYLVLLEGIVKKTQKTPKSTLALIKARRKKID